MRFVPHCHQGCSDPVQLLLLVPADQTLRSPGAARGAAALLRISKEHQHGEQGRGSFAKRLSSFWYTLQLTAQTSTPLRKRDANCACSCPRGPPPQGSSAPGLLPAAGAASSTGTGSSMGLPSKSMCCPLEHVWDCSCRMSPSSHGKEGPSRGSILQKNKQYLKNTARNRLTSWCCIYSLPAVAFEPIQIFCVTMSIVHSNPVGRQPKPP